MLVPKALVFINLRYSERVVSEAGSRLDRVIGMRPRERAELLATLAQHARRFSADDVRFKPARFTGVMRSQFSSMFGGDMFQFDLPASGAVLDVAMEGVEGAMRVDDVFACFSGSSRAAGVEGDDLVFCIVLRAVDGAGAAPACALDKRPKNCAEAIALLHACAPAIGALGLRGERFTQLPVPGFYFLSDQRWQGESGTDGPGVAHFDLRESNSILMVVGCYLFYCWLICQRAERLLNQLSFDGDRDVEARKFILTRKKTVSAMRYAHIKNRTEPGSPGLPVFHRIHLSFRLQEQIDNLSVLSEEFQKTITLQESYRDSAQLTNIQWILFIFAILSLGVALNALPMAPFALANTKNALAEKTFWLVFAAMAAVTLMLWTAILMSRRCRRAYGRFLVFLTR